MCVFTKGMISFPESMSYLPVHATLGFTNRGWIREIRQLAKERPSSPPGLRRLFWGPPETTAMEIEGEMLRQAGLALVGVAVFVAFLIAGSTMGAGEGEQVGTLVMVAGIVAFIVVMGALGLLFLDGD